MSSHHEHGPPREGVCIDKMTVSVVGAAVLLSLAAAVFLAYYRISDMPQAFLGVAGAGLAGLLALAQGKRGPQTTVNTDTAMVSSGGGSPAPANVENMSVSTTAPDPSDGAPAVTRGGGAG